MRHSSGVAVGSGVGSGVGGGGGATVGSGVGWSVGRAVGGGVGAVVGRAVGRGVGRIVGAVVGRGVTADVGTGVGVGPVGVAAGAVVPPPDVPPPCGELFDDPLPPGLPAPGATPGARLAGSGSPLAVTPPTDPLASTTAEGAGSAPVAAGPDVRGTDDERTPASTTVMISPSTTPTAVCR